MGVGFHKKANHGTEMETRLSRIARNYLRTWFAIDLLSIIHFDMLGMLVKGTNMENFKVVEVVRLLRLVKLMRVVRASQLLQRFELRMSITYRQLELFKFFIMLLVITHWLANLWALSLVLVD